MLKRCAVLFVLLSVILSCGYSFVSGKESHDESMPIDQAFNDMIKDFALYTAFFNDTYPAGYFNISKHADTAEQACSYFSQGFDEQLASDIVDTYTFWNQEIKKLQIIPTDGLPVLEAENANLISCSYIDHENVIFERCFNNYYGANSSYLYRVFCRYDGQRWKIYKLEWEAVDKKAAYKIL